MILVAGATGALGFEICRRLRARKVPVCAIVRPISPGARIADLEDLGVEFRPGDLTNPGSLLAACEGASVVISAVTGAALRGAGDSIHAVDRDGQIAFADASQRAGARHMITISASGSIADAAPLIAAKRAVERHLHEIELDHTNLRAGFLMDFWLGPAGGFDVAAGSVQVLGCGDRPVSWIAREDIAAIAVLAALNPAPGGATYELGGPQALSQLDVVRMAEDITGRPIAVAFVPEQSLRHTSEQATAPVEKSVAELMLHVAGGAVVDMTPTLERFPIQQTYVRDYLWRSLNRAPQLSRLY